MAKKVRKIHSGSFPHEDMYEFYKVIQSVAHESGQSTYAVFFDMMRVFAITLHNPIFAGCGMAKEYERYSSEVAETFKKYRKEGTPQRFEDAFQILCTALEKRREDFLGQVMEKCGATDEDADQFFTPICVSRFMAKVAVGGDFKAQLEAKRKDWNGDFLTVNDPACGASVNLIEAAEAAHEAGFPQDSVLLYAEDIGTLPFCVSYIQLSLLGYPAVVTRMNSLTREVYEGPWHTPCWFAHQVPQRMAEKKRLKERVDKFKSILRVFDGMGAGGNGAGRGADGADSSVQVKENSVSELPQGEEVSKPFASIGGVQLELGL